MRIIAGDRRGRPLAAPQGRDTRPTSDRAREGLFARRSATAFSGSSLPAHGGAHEEHAGRTTRTCPWP